MKLTLLFTRDEKKPGQDGEGGRGAASNDAFSRLGTDEFYPYPWNPARSPKLCGENPPEDCDEFEFTKK